MDHLGIDVHKKDSQICILAEGGELIEQRIRTEPERFAAVLGARAQGRILLEASTDSEWVARCVEGLGHEVIVADPKFAPMYATRTRKVKTDRRDARALADACLLGAYRRAHRLSDPQRHVRGRLTVRDAVVRTRTRSIALIRALLRQQGSRVPSGSAEGFLHRGRAMPLPSRLVSTIAPLLAVMRHLNAQLAYADETIARVQRLRTVPSVGPVTAAAFVATLDDAQRFRHAHQVEAYLGLVPREYSSGESQHRGHITKAAPPRMRWLLIQLAVSILRRRPPQAEALHAWALHIAARHAHRRRGPRPPGGRHPLCAAPGRHDVRPPPLATTRGRGHAPSRSDWMSARDCPGLSQVRWVGERECRLGRPRGPSHRWRPHPSNPLVRRRALSLAPDEREEKDDDTSRDRTRRVSDEQRQQQHSMEGHEELTRPAAS